VINISAKGTVKRADAYIACYLRYRVAKVERERGPKRSITPSWGAAVLHPYEDLLALKVTKQNGADRKSAPLGRYSELGNVR
jgi:hypothetical protein